MGVALTVPQSELADFSCKRPEQAGMATQAAWGPVPRNVSYPNHLGVWAVQKQPVAGAGSWLLDWGPALW